MAELSKKHQDQLHSTLTLFHQAKMLEDEAKGLKSVAQDSAKEVLQEAGIDSYSEEGVGAVTQYTSKSSALDKEALKLEMVAAGIDADQVAAMFDRCTVRKETVAVKFSLAK